MTFKKVINGQTIEIELTNEEMANIKREYDKKRLELAIVDDVAFYYSDYQITKEQVEELAEKWVDKVTANGYNEMAYDNGLTRDIEKLIGFDPELED